MPIRKMHPDDIGQVSRMVVDSFRHCVAPNLPPEGVDTFVQIASEEAFAERMAGANLLWVYETDGEIPGMIELRERRHIAMLFVAPAKQRLGIGQALVQRALRRCTSDSVTVNASLPSVRAYENYGFQIAGPREQIRGLIYQPMRRNLRQSGRRDDNSHD